jgi:hypothetical protein
MYYEEKIMDGVLMYKTNPNGEWMVATGTRAEAVNSLVKLSEEQRLEVVMYFCPHCGGFSPCQCWKGE